jgi:hypothetical protein
MMTSFTRLGILREQVLEVTLPKSAVLFLVPFLLFNYEAKFKVYKEHPECMKELTEDLEQVVSRLEQLNMCHEIDVREYAMLIDMTKKVLEHIAKDYEIVKKEVKKIMGGTVLEYESKTIWNNAKAVGVAEGKAVGMADAVLELLEVMGPVPSDLEFWITQETDLTVLKRWLQLAARATSIEEFREKAGI